MKISRLVTSCSTAALLFASLPGNADFGGHLSFISQFSDNAERTPDGDISEWQDKYALGVYGDYENSLVTLEADYTASMHRYEKDSQPRREMLEGSSSLRLGKEHNLFDVLFMHSRYGVLNEPDAVDLLSNQDERQIIAVVPTFHAPITDVDSVMVRGNYAKTDYRYYELNNSEASGASLIWQHKLSPVDTLELSAHQSSVTFDDVPDADYDYTAILLTYAATLRQLTYKVSAGSNRSSRANSEDYSGPALALEAQYLSGVNTFTFSANQKITDTSMGDGNDQGFGVDYESRDVTGTGVDQIERRSMELRWNTQALCERCDLSVGVHVRDDDYLTLPEDNIETGASVGISYRLSPSASLSLRASRRDQSFDGVAVARDEHTLDQVGVAYSYKFVNGINVSVFAEQRERESESQTTDYEETLTGLTLSYQF